MVNFMTILLIIFYIWYVGYSFKSQQIAIKTLDIFGEQWYLCSMSNLLLTFCVGYLLSILYGTSDETFKNKQKKPNEENIEEFGLFEVKSWNNIWGGLKSSVCVFISFFIFSIFLKYLKFNKFPLFKIDGFKTDIKVEDFDYMQLFINNIFGFVSLFVFIINSPLRILLSGLTPTDGYTELQNSGEYSTQNVKNLYNKYKKENSEVGGLGIRDINGIKKNLNSSKKKVEVDEKNEMLDKLIRTVVYWLSPALDISIISQKQNDGFFTSQCVYFKFLFWIMLILPNIFNIVNKYSMLFILWIFVLHPLLNSQKDIKKKIGFFILICTIFLIYSIINTYIPTSLSVLSEIINVVLLLGLSYVVYRLFNDKEMVVINDEPYIPNIHLWRIYSENSNKYSPLDGIGSISGWENGNSLNKHKLKQNKHNQN
jgi:hypothetical protein